MEGSPSFGVNVKIEYPEMEHIDTGITDGDEDPEYPDNETGRHWMAQNDSQSINVGPEPAEVEIMPRQEHVHLRNKIYRCVVCQQLFTSKKVMKKHMLSHNDNLFQCNECSKTFSSEKYLKRHKLIHNRTRSFQCSECNKSFSTKSYLRKHQTVHNENNMYECEICKKTFSSKNYLKQHIKIHDDSRVYECQECRKVFASEKSLKQHISIYRNTKMYECKDCKKLFSSEKSLKRHINTHNNHKTYKCALCNKSFSSDKSVKQHMNIHLQGKPYQCDTCKKHFSTKDYLKQHVFVHINNRIYECHRCKKTFSSKKSLKQHIKLHYFTRSYDCVKCKNSFTTKEALNQHINLHGEKRLCDCDHCKRVLSYCEAVHHHRMHRCHRYDSDRSSSGNSDDEFECKQCERNHEQVSFYETGHQSVHSNRRVRESIDCKRSHSSKKHCLMGHHAHSQTHRKSYLNDEYSPNNHSHTENHHRPIDPPNNLPSSSWSSTPSCSSYNASSSGSPGLNFSPMEPQPSTSRDNSPQEENDDYQFQCEFCGKKFPTKKTLRYHQYVHPEMTV